MTEAWQTMRPHHIVTPGTRQTDRTVAAFGDGFFGIEDRGTAGLLTLATRLADEVRYVTAENTMSGTWGQLLRKHPVVLMAEIISVDLEALLVRHQADLASRPQRAAAEIVTLARSVRRWIDGSTQQDGAGTLVRLGLLDNACRERISALANGRPEAIAQALEDAGCAPETDPGQGQALRVGMGRALVFLRTTIAALQPRAAEAFEAAVTSKTVDPSIGLLIAELEAARPVIDRVNHIKQRHTDFYYGDILGQVPRKGRPAHALLHLPDVPTRLKVPKGQVLSATLDDGRDIRFRTETALTATPAQIARHATLRYGRNRETAQYAALGIVTDIAAEIGAPEEGLGGSRLFATAPHASASMGLRIHSDVLHLREGDRSVEIVLSLVPEFQIALDLDAEDPLRQIDGLVEAMEHRLDRDLLTAFGLNNPAAAVAALRPCIDPAEAVASGDAPIAVYAALARLVDHRLTAGEDADACAHALRALLGRIVAAALVEGLTWPRHAWETVRHVVNEDAMRRRLTGLGRRMEEDNSFLERLFPLDSDDFVYSLDDLFAIVLGDAFQLSLGMAEGTLPVPHFEVHRAGRATGATLVRGPGAPPLRTMSGIAFSLRLDAIAPSIQSVDAAQPPSVTIAAAEDARIAPFSFFEHYRLDTISVRVAVSGLRPEAGFSPVGPVAVDQVFQPFGPQPRDGAEFWAVSSELARKAVTEVHVNVDWADLPAGPDGQASLFGAYGRDGARPDPKINLAYLSGDGLKPLGSPGDPMIGMSPVDGSLAKTRQFGGSVVGTAIRAAGAVTPEEVRNRQTVRAGAICLTLGGTAGGFLADHYPTALAQAMRPGMLTRKTEPLPPPPFVPRLSRLTIDYRAERRIDLSDPRTAEPGEQVVQIGPFADERVFPTEAPRGFGLFPKRLGDGVLFLEIGAAEPGSALSLLFEFDERGSSRVKPPRNALDWHVLAAMGWEPIADSRILSDTTEGLMRSGVVTLRLPESLTLGSPLMPPGGLWLAIATSGAAIDAFPYPKSLRTNGFWAVAEDATVTNLPSKRRWAFAPAISGLPAPEEVFLRPPRVRAETKDAFRTRIAERLRHRQRAITPWDIEHLVLEAFPEVWMAKCIPRRSRLHVGQAPGHVNVVIVPRAPDGSGASPVPALFNAIMLDRVRAFLDDLKGDFARIDVTNPSYERLQLRGHIQLAEDADDLDARDDILGFVNRYLSVWTAPPSLGRFGWSVNVDTVAAQLCRIDSVAAVSGCSLVQIAADDGGTHDLRDTARAGRSSLGPLDPWSLPLAAADHMIRISGSDDGWPAEAAGIGSLKVGQTFISTPG